MLEPNTRVIDIHYLSHDKELAAKVVNTLASTYIEQNFKTDSNRPCRRPTGSHKQLVDLQIKVETSQEKL